MKYKRMILSLLVVVPILLIGTLWFVSGGNIRGMLDVMLWSDPSDTKETAELFEKSKVEETARHLAEFDLSNLVIEESELISAANSIDSIMALVMPGKTPIDKQTDISPDERVIVVEVDDIAVAYPIMILNWHEIINDVILDTPIAVSY